MYSTHNNLPLHHKALRLLFTNVPRPCSLMLMHSTTGLATPMSSFIQVRILDIPVNPGLAHLVEGMLCHFVGRHKISHRIFHLSHHEAWICHLLTTREKTRMRTFQKILAIGHLSLPNPSFLNIFSKFFQHLTRINHPRMVLCFKQLLLHHQLVPFFSICCQCFCARSLTNCLTTCSMFFLSILWTKDMNDSFCWMFWHSLPNLI
jgi:hypothetical protein